MTPKKQSKDRSAGRILLVVLGSLSLAFGAVGILIPVLPTTPLLLLAAFCYLRSSRKLYQWLVHHRLFGRYIYHYLEYRAVPMKTKIGAILILWASLVTSMILVNRPAVQLILLVIGLLVSAHILSLKTLKTSDAALQELPPEAQEHSADG